MGNVINVAYSLDDFVEKIGLIFYTAIRNNTLDYIYSKYPDFSDRSQRVKTYIYDTAKKEIGREMSREAALKYQEYFSENALSYEQIAQYQALFSQLASDFDLTDEFTENGII